MEGEVNYNERREEDMKKFDVPTVEVVHFNVSDIITTSGGIENGENMTDKG